MADTAQSKNHRYQVGDKVQWVDDTEWPPVIYTGTVTGFENDELTYLEVTLTNEAADDKLLSKPKVLVLTEDDISR